MNGASPDRTATVQTVAALCLVAACGYAAISIVAINVSTRMLPWVLGRALGIAGYLSLVAMVIVGLLLRHPWRVATPRLAAQTAHHIHAFLAPMTGLLITGHVVALAIDRYAGVGLSGAVIPGAATYRPIAVGIGTTSLYVGMVVGLSAAFSGRIGTRAWLPLHRLAYLALAGTWIHAILAGSDLGVLLPMYVVTALAIMVLALTRRLAAVPRSMMDVKTDIGGAVKRTANDRPGRARWRRPAVDHQVRINMVACTAHGICTHALAERISLDPWGFPATDADPISSRRLLRKAKRAASACPQRALLVVPVDPPPGSS